MFNIFNKKNNDKKQINLNFIKIPDTKSLFVDNSLTPDKVLYAISQKEIGKLQELNTILENLIDKDLNLAGVIDTRKATIKAKSVILPENLTENQKEYFNKINTKFYPHLIDFFIDAKLKGFGFGQVIFKLKNNLYFPEKIKTYKYVDLRIVDDTIKLYQNDKPRNTQPPKFISLLFNRSVLQTVLKYYLFASFALNNWASFTEIFGKPIRIGKYKLGASKDEKNELWNMLQSAGTDLAAMVSENVTMEFIDHAAKSASADLYDKLISFVDKAVTKRILGQTLTTDANTTGSYAQSYIHNLIREDIAFSDATEASVFLSDFYTQLYKINFANREIEVNIDLSRPINKKDRIAIDEKLNNIIDIPAEYFYKTYNIPLPENGKPKKIESDKPFFALDPQKRGYFAQSLANQYQNSKINKIANIARKFASNLNSFNDIKNAKFPHNLAYSFGYELTASILNAYTKAKKDTLKNQSNIFPSHRGVSVRTGCFPSHRGVSEGQGVQTSTFRMVENLRNGCLSPFTKEMSEGQGVYPSNIKIKFDFSLDDIAALAAFRSEAFIVAGILAEESLNQLKKEAELAISKGITFADFRQNIKLKGFEPDNPYYLRTNFNTAINNAYLAGQYNQSMQNIDILPYFRYVAIMDDRTRDEHAALHGTIKRKDDPFWDTYFPPNGWNCRCSVEELTEKEAKSDPMFKKEPPLIPIDHIWQKNTGKDKTIWGKWLDCNSPKNLSNLFFLNSHCPDKYTKTYKDYKLKDWKDLPENRLKKLLNTDNLTKEQLLAEYEKYLNNRTIKDVLNIPVKLLKSKSNKFKKGYSIKEIRNRFKYLYHIDDVIQNPDEIWFYLDHKRYKYLKKYKKNIVILIDFVDGQMEYFNIFISSSDKYIDKQRKGFLVYRKKRTS